MSSLDFSGLLARAGIKSDTLAPEMSEPCTLCENIFCAETKQK